MRVTDTCFYTIARDRSKSFFLIYILFLDAAKNKPRWKSRENDESNRDEAAAVRVFESLSRDLCRSNWFYV